MMFRKILAGMMQLPGTDMPFALNAKVQSTSLMTAIVLSLLMTPAHATMTEVFGGPGGGHFSMTCNPGSFLVGFHARAGAWVDGIGLLCASYNASTGNFGRNTPKGYAGGRGGTKQEAYCAPGETVTAIALAHTRGGGLPRQYVNTVDIRCQHRQVSSGCISSGEGCGAIPTKVVGSIILDTRDYKYDLLSCPASEVATGIQGRYGSYVDAIGLICDRAPKKWGPPITSLGKYKKPKGPSGTPITSIGKAKAKPAGIPITSIGKVKARPKPAGTPITSLGKRKSVLGTCKSGYVYRDAKDGGGDGVCVTPAERKVAKAQNAKAKGRRQIGGGNTCKQGYVWREAFGGDVACVTPQERAEAERQNNEAPSHTN